MRGSDVRSGELFSYVDLEKRVPAKHPLRLVRVVVNEVLSRLDGDFAKAYAIGGPLQLRLSGCCGRFCCRRSIRSGRNGS
jgi:hypothetical protein